VRQTGFSTKVGSTTEIRAGSDVVVVSEPTLGATLRTKGRFYFLCEVMPQGKAGADVAREVAELTREQYEYDLSAGIEGAIRKALRDANRRATHRLRDQHGRVTLHAACAVLVNNELYAARIGQAQIFLVRRARLFLPGDDSSELADFVHRTTTRRAASLGSDPDLLPAVWKQAIEPGDTIILGGGNAIAALGADALLNAAVTLHPRAAAEHLHNRFLAEGGSGSDSVLLIEVSPATTTAPRIASAPEPSRPLEEVLVAETIRSRVDVIWRHRPRIGRAVGAVAAPAAGAVGKSLAIGLELMPHRTTMLGGPMRTTRERSRRQQRLISLLALALLVVSIIIGAVVVRDYQVNSVFASYNLVVLAASNDLDSAQSFIDRKPAADEDRARQKLDSARAHIAEASSSTVANTEQLAALSARAEALFDRLNDVLLDVSTLAPGAQLASFAQTQFGLYAADPGSGRMWRVFEQPPGMTTAAAVLQKGKAGVGNPLRVTSVDNALFTVDDQNKVWKAEGNTVVEVSPDGREKWKSVTGLVSFSGNLYVLDTASGQIWRHEEDRGKYLAADPVLAQAFAPNTITSLAVDGSFWVTTTTGEVGLFKRVGLATTATKADFTIRWIGEPVKASAIQAIDSQRNIYLLDAAGRRLVQLTRDGREVARFDLPKDLPPPTAFFVSEGQHTVYTANGAKIAATDLSR
jgi:sugar lactone lactonase YvrE